jgi:deoxyribonuclease-4
MLPNGTRLGAHLPLGKGMVWAANRAAEIGASALQVFTDNPASWRRRAGPPRELPAFRERLAELGIEPLVVHAPYLINLAAPEADPRERSIDRLANELRVAEAYGAQYVNVHIGSHRGDGTAAGIDRVAAGVRDVLDRLDGEARDVVIVLENGTGGGFGLGSRMEELGAIDRAIRATGVADERYGFCLDTAHLWGAGYRIDRAAGVDVTVAAFDEQVGLERLRLVHLNDSRSDLASRFDRHEHIGAGRIGAEGLARVVTHPALRGATFVLETPGMDEGYDSVNMARVGDIVAGRPLDPLPPAAFHTRSAKGRSAPADDDGPGGA